MRKLEGLLWAGGVVLLCCLYAWMMSFIHESFS